MHFAVVVVVVVVVVLFFLLTDTGTINREVNIN